MEFTRYGLVYQLKCSQTLPIPLDEAWAFLSRPENLKTITPEYMSFDILSGGDTEMYPGQIIQYIVTPVLGIKTHWVTEITHVKDNSYFVDEQRFGPYKLWHHKHILKPGIHGTEMEDIIDFKLPIGILGRFIFPLLIKPKLTEIFQYRRKKLEELFGSPQRT
ncbi:SRPBCC family protein [Formosa sp. S-31]|uniref:SRPBCC family protein n=1 Tax=Formosa sp. S-31 TaxID=2790949 RepID=UPI003EBF0F33